MTSVPEDWKARALAAEAEREDAFLHIASWKARSSRAEGLLGEAVKVLEPFAKASVQFTDLPDRLGVCLVPWGYAHERATVSVSELRAAAALLSSISGGEVYSSSSPAVAAAPNGATADQHFDGGREP